MSKIDLSGEAAAKVARLRDTFDSGRTRPLEWRRHQLQSLRRLLVEREPELAEALHQDLGKPAVESFVTELGFTRSEIDHVLSHLSRWMRPTRVRVPMALRPARARVEPQPLGVVLVISPWNYPVQLLLAPLCGALAAGNCALLKPSELAPATSNILARLLPEYLDPDAVAVVEGDADTTTALLEQRFDHVFFTGGTRVAKIVMAAAARHLTPVTLELGGKCPAIVNDGDLLAAARRIAYAKFINAGQTCVAPDYVLVESSRADELLRHLRAVLLEFFGADPITSPDYGRIINRKHFERLVGLLGHGRIHAGGRSDAGQLFLEPTVIVEPAEDSELMDEEIFGPILPVIPVAGIDAAVQRVRAGPAPLAAYVFTERAGVRRSIEDGVRAGAIGINVCAAHLAVPGLPFGGLGPSGMGAYHGKQSFETFSQLRPVFSKGTWLDTLRVVYPPYTRAKTAALRRLL